MKNLLEVKNLVASLEALMRTNSTTKVTALPVPVFVKRYGI